jgi:hypothetical protein
MQTLLGHSLGQSCSAGAQAAAETGYAVCDVNQLENAILNLGINARDAMRRRPAEHLHPACARRRRA